MITYFPAALRSPKLEEMFQALQAQLDQLCAFGLLIIQRLNPVTVISKKMQVKHLVKEGWHQIENRHKRQQLARPGFLNRRKGLAIAASRRFS